jgi:hypothetical protein
MSRCEYIITEDGTRVLVNFAGPGLTLSDMEELNNFARQRREKFEKKKNKPKPPAK